jgi:hypothetical protein
MKTNLNFHLHHLARVILIMLLSLITSASWAQQDARDAFYTPPSNSKYKKVGGTSSGGNYGSAYDWAVKFYPVRLWYDSKYFGLERFLTDDFSIALDAGWHSSSKGFFANAVGHGSVLDFEFSETVETTFNYAELFATGILLNNTIPTVGFSVRYLGQGKEGNSFPFVQAQYQFSAAKLLMQNSTPTSFTDNRFAALNDTAQVQIHTAMLRFGRQWVYGNKIKLINELSFGIGANLRMSSAYNDVVINPNTANSYSLHSLTGEMWRMITPRLQIAYSIGIGY